jgi:transcriptional regulator with XRE-family HTH domain
VVDSTKDVAESMNVSQNYIARIEKKKTSDVAPNHGGKPPLYIFTEKKACVRAVTLGGIEVAI